jgi:hypothetical protein
MADDKRAREEETSRCKDRLKTTHKNLREQRTVLAFMDRYYLTVPLNDIQ